MHLQLEISLKRVGILEDDFLCPYFSRLSGLEEKGEDCSLILRFSLKFAQQRDEVDHSCSPAGNLFRLFSCKNLENGMISMETGSHAIKDKTIVSGMSTASEDGAVQSSISICAFLRT